MHHKKAIVGVLQANLSIFDTILLYAHFPSSRVEQNVLSKCMKFSRELAQKAIEYHYRNFVKFIHILYNKHNMKKKEKKM